MNKFFYWLKDLLEPLDHLNDNDVIFLVMLFACFLGACIYWIARKENQSK